MSKLDKLDKSLTKYRHYSRLGRTCFLVSMLVYALLGVFTFKYNGDISADIKSAYVIVGLISILLGFVFIYLANRALTHQRQNVKRQISKAPGSRLLVIVEYLYAPKIVEGVFKPIISDWRTEYFNALNECKSKKAAWISIRYIFSFGMAMGLSKVLSVIKSVAHR